MGCRPCWGGVCRAAKQKPLLQELSAGRQPDRLLTKSPARRGSPAATRCRASAVLPRSQTVLHRISNRSAARRRQSSSPGRALGSCSALRGPSGLPPCCPTLRGRQDAVPAGAGRSGEPPGCERVAAAAAGDGVAGLLVSPQPASCTAPPCLWLCLLMCNVRPLPPPRFQSQPSAHAPASGVGFAQTQLLTLRRQIVCFKELKKWRSGERKEPLRSDELAGLQPPPLLPPLQPGAAPAVASAPPPATAFPAPGQALPQAQLQPGMQFPAGMAVPPAGVPGMVTPAALAAAQQQQAAAQAAAVAAAQQQQAQAAAAAAVAAQQQQQAAAQQAAQQAATQQAAQQAAQQSQQSQPAPALPQARQSARNSGQGPIFTLAAAPRGGHFQPPAPQSGFLRPQQVRPAARAAAPMLRGVWASLVACMVVWALVCLM